MPQYPFNPEMLELAMALRGLTQVGLANELNISQSHVSKIIMKVLDCDDDLAAKISKVLRFPDSFFRQQRRVWGLPLSVHGEYRPLAGYFTEATSP